MLGRDVLLVITAIGLLVHEATIWDGASREWVWAVAAGVGLSPMFTRKGDRSDPGPTRRPGTDELGPGS